MGYAPLSFVTKAEVKKWPFIGILAKARQCVFVDRNCEDARKKTR
jgi:1-acyl-sn-glycerol-3-phosphate acyltransferase